MPRERNAVRTPTIDLNLPGYGRFVKAAGTNDPKMIEGLRVMLRDLADRGKLEYLRRIKSHELSMLKTYEEWKNKALPVTPIMEGEQKFLNQALDWLKDYEAINDKTRDDYKCTYTMLSKLGGKAMKVADAPNVLRKYKASCAKRHTTRQFNATRNQVRSFLRNTVGANSTVYQEVVNIAPLAGQPKRQATAQSVKAIVELTAKLPENIAEMVWTLCTTGMEPITTYMADKWEEGDGCVLIHGTKMDHLDGRRNRTVPMILPPTKAVCQIKAFRRHLYKVTRAIQVYDFRRTYAHWLYEAGVSEIRIEQYMGHLATSMSRRYGRTDVKDFLAKDAQRVFDWIEEQKDAIQSGNGRADMAA
jgi:hypothetical protein